MIENRLSSHDVCSFLSKYQKVLGEGNNALSGFEDVLALIISEIQYTEKSCEKESSEEWMQARKLTGDVIEMKICTLETLKIILPIEILSATNLMPTPAIVMKKIRQTNTRM